MKKETLFCDWQVSEGTAIALAERMDWAQWDSWSIVKFQLFQRRLCMPFSFYHDRLAQVLRRPVCDHELAEPESLIRELFPLVTYATKPSVDDVVWLLIDHRRWMR